MKELLIPVVTLLKILASEARPPRAIHIRSKSCMKKMPMYLLYHQTNTCKIIYSLSCRFNCGLPVQCCRVCYLMEDTEQIQGLHWYVERWTPTLGEKQLTWQEATC